MAVYIYLMLAYIVLAMRSTARGEQESGLVTCPVVSLEAYTLNAFYNRILDHQSCEGEKLQHGIVGHIDEVQKEILRETINCHIHAMLI